jgi:TRAP-type C4-dicarboxylate transport system substrate-binding protein
VLNQAFFEAQSPELQAALIEAGKRSVDATLAYTANQDREGLEFLKGKGVAVHEVADLAGLKARVAPMVDKWAQSDPLIAEFVAEAQASV